MQPAHVDAGTLSVRFRTAGTLVLGSNGRMGWVVTLFGVLAVLSVFPSHTGAIVHAQKDAQAGGSGSCGLE